MISLANVYHKLKLFRVLRDIKVEVKFLFPSNMSSTTLALLAVGAMAMLGNCHGYPLQQIISSTTSEIEKASSDTFSSQQYSVSDGLGSLSSSSISEKSYDYNNYEAEQINSLTSTPDGIMQTTQQQMDQYNSNSQFLSQVQQDYNMYPADDLLAQPTSLYETTNSEALLAQQEKQLYSATSNDLLQTEMNSEYYANNLMNYEKEQGINYGKLDYSDDSDDSDDSS